MVEEVIQREIAQKGTIPFWRYMEICLYHPQGGYYMLKESPRGKSGDYYTAPTVGPVFGWLLAEAIAELSSFYQGDFNLVEVGSGEGYLLSDILSYLEAYCADVFERVKVISVELNPYMVQRQKEALKRFSGKVQWTSWDDLEGIRGCVIANELLDSFPFHRVKFEAGELFEVYVDYRGGRFCEVLEEAKEELKRYFEWLGIWPEEGAYAEVGLFALAFLEEAYRKLENGHLLLIDYGDEAEVLLSDLFPKGTLRTYKRHLLGGSPYEHPGQMDITAHVDFTALRKRAQELGFRVKGYMTQSAFLLEMLKRLKVSLGERENLELKRLLLPSEMGSIYKVLLLEKEGIDDRAYPFCTPKPMGSSEGP